MGCDIHLYSETKKDGIWVADKADSFNQNEDADENGEDGYVHINSSYSGERNYQLFGLLNTNVRADSPWSFDENGFPDDASPEITAYYKHWDTDAHSASYLTRQDLKKKATELLIVADKYAHDLCGYLAALIGGLPDCTDTEEQRIVFWFDN